MRAEAVVTVIGMTVLAGAVVVYLSIIAYQLTKAHFALGTVLIGVRAIANQTEPIAAVVGSIGNDIAAIDGALQNLVEDATAPAAPARRTRARSAP